MRIGLVLLVFPFVELAVLIQIADWIGLLPTVLLLIASMLLGAALLRATGLAAAWRMRQVLASGAPPQAALLDSLCWILVSLLLLLPGFVSDGLALALCLPKVRLYTTQRMHHWLEARTFQKAGAGQQADWVQRGSSAQIIEGEFERRDQ